jgi:hypothetical protein
VIFTRNFWRPSALLWLLPSRVTRADARCATVLGLLTHSTNPRHDTQGRDVFAVWRDLILQNGGGGEREQEGAQKGLAIRATVVAKPPIMRAGRAVESRTPPHLFPARAGDLDARGCRAENVQNGQI